MTLTTHATPRLVIALIIVGMVGNGCRQDPLLDSLNLAPVANAGADQKLEYAGTPVEVTLDGSASADPDGRIKKWSWFPATGRADGEPGIVLPPDESDSNWPDDVVKPVVRLPQGVWNFALWVEDDAGSISEPSTVKITIGNPDPLADPQVAACANDVLPSVPLECRACVCNPPNSSDDVVTGCRMNVAQTSCGADCWALINCTASKCPDFAKDPMAGLGCLGANCVEFLGSGAAAMAAGGCVIACGPACAPPP